MSNKISLLTILLDRIALPTNISTLKWYKANYGAIGFYRVNYDDENWSNLLKQINVNHTVSFIID